MKILPLLTLASLALGSPLRANVPAAADKKAPAESEASKVIRAAVGKVLRHTFQEKTFTWPGGSLIIGIEDNDATIRVFNDDAGEFYWISDNDLDGVVDMARGTSQKGFHFYLRHVPSTGAPLNGYQAQAWQVRYDRLIAFIAAELKRPKVATK